MLCRASWFAIGCQLDAVEIPDLCQIWNLARFKHGAIQKNDHLHGMRMRGIVAPDAVIKPAANIGAGERLDSQAGQIGLAKTVLETPLMSHLPGLVGRQGNAAGSRLPFRRRQHPGLGNLPLVLLAIRPAGEQEEFIGVASRVAQNGGH